MCIYAFWLEPFLVLIMYMAPDKGVLSPFSTKDYWYFSDLSTNIMKTRLYNFDPL